tara:strand:+ start:1387 stop:1653 length:267 start_codon:yes stop_codon:yes gene_type:complete
MGLGRYDRFLGSASEHNQAALSGQLLGSGYNPFGYGNQSAAGLGASQYSNPFGRGVEASFDRGTEAPKPKTIREELQADTDKWLKGVI